MSKRYSSFYQRWAVFQSVVWGCLLGSVASRDNLNFVLPYPAMIIFVISVCLCFAVLWSWVSEGNK